LAVLCACKVMTQVLQYAETCNRDTKNAHTHTLPTMKGSGGCKPKRFARQAAVSDPHWFWQIEFSRGVRTQHLQGGLSAVSLSAIFLCLAVSLVSFQNSSEACNVFSWKTTTTQVLFPMMRTCFSTTCVRPCERWCFQLGRWSAQFGWVRFSFFNSCSGL
jgi:hypothetical protein